MLGIVWSFSMPSLFVPHHWLQAHTHQTLGWNCGPSFDRLGVCVFDAQLKDLHVLAQQECGPESNSHEWIHTMPLCVL